MTKHRVSFGAHKKEKVETKVSFETKDGMRVRFPAHKTEKVPVRVSFLAKDKKK